MTSASTGSDERFDFSLDAATKASVVAQSGYVNTGTPGPTNIWAVWTLNGVSIGQLTDPPNTLPTEFPPHTTFDSLGMDTGNAPGAQFTVDILIESIAGTGNAHVIASSDYGVTVGAPSSVGASPGISGGFDLLRAADVSYAAAHNALKKATTLGGAYSAFASLSANPICACIPYYQVGSNSVKQTTSSSPQVLIGYDVPVSGTCIAWINGAGTVTPIDNPVSGAFFDLPNCITTLRGTKAAIIVNVSGIHKLYVTENLQADGSASWTFIEDVTANATLRTRRNDSRTGSHKGQLFVFDTPSGYSSRWAFVGEFNRVSPSGTILAGDILG